MRKVGILSDAEQTRNKDFKQTQLASREHIKSRLAKAKNIEKELKYADRVPTRVPGGLVRVNLRDKMIGMDRRIYVDKPIAQHTAENNTVQGSAETRGGIVGALQAAGRFFRGEPPPPRKSARSTAGIPATRLIETKK